MNIADSTTGLPTAHLQNPSTAGSYQVAVSSTHTTEDATRNVNVEGLSVSNVRAGTDTLVAGSDAQVALEFITNHSLPVGDKIRVTLPQGFTVPSTLAASQVTVGNSFFSQTPSAAAVSEEPGTGGGRYVTLTVPDMNGADAGTPGIAAGEVSVTLDKDHDTPANNISNPDSAGDYILKVRTEDSAGTERAADAYGTAHMTRLTPVRPTGDGTITINGIGISPNGVSQYSTVTANFDTGDAMSVGEEINISFPVGFTVSSTLADADGVISINGVRLSADQVAVSANTLTLNVPDTEPDIPGDQEIPDSSTVVAVVNIADPATGEAGAYIQNAPGAATTHQFVITTTDAAGHHSLATAIEELSVSGVTAALDTIEMGGDVKITVRFTTNYHLAAGQAIRITLPSAFTVPAGFSASQATIENALLSQTPSSMLVSDRPSADGGGKYVTLTVPDMNGAASGTPGISAGEVSVTLDRDAETPANNIRNPDTAGEYTIGVRIPTPDDTLDSETRVDIPTPTVSNVTATVNPMLYGQRTRLTVKFDTNLTLEGGTNEDKILVLLPEAFGVNDLITNSEITVSANRAAAPGEDRGPGRT